MKKIAIFAALLALLTIPLSSCGKVSAPADVPDTTADSVAVSDTEKSPETEGQTETASPETEQSIESETAAPETVETEQKTPDDAPTDGAVIRILSYNVLCELWNDRLPVPGRDTVVAGLINETLPDVAGLQELSGTWYSALGTLIGSKYVFVNGYNNLGQRNYTGLAYNKETVELIQDGCEIFSVGDTDIRLMNWGLFKHIESGEYFIVMNTHWNTSVSTEPANSLRMVHATEMGQRVRELAVDYECPVIATGDFNAGRGTEEFKLYEEKAKTKDAQEHADERVNADRYTMHYMGVTPPVFPNSIDHITYTEGVRAIYFEHFIDTPYLGASDHTPIMCDFRFE